MATSKKRAAKKPTLEPALGSNVDEVVARLKRLGTRAVREGLVRYAIPSDKALGIPVGVLRKLGQELGRDHLLAQSLWATDIYEARLLATFVENPEQVTPAQMDRWCKDFDSWAICDTACFHLFDKTPHAFDKVHKWSTRREEMEKRAAFALLASLALHAKQAEDAPFLQCLPLIERAATDPRNFVKKGVSWALRGIGLRKSPHLKNAAFKLAEALAASPDPSTRWVGKDAVRDLSKKRG